jgi:hypothetical protein
LSPDAKDVFRSALGADGEYTTTTAPEDFVYQDDTDTDLNYIRYNSECYALQADPGGGFGLGIMIGLLLFGGGLAMLVLLSAGLGSLVSDRFKLPMAVLSGVATVVTGFTVAHWPSLKVLFGTTIGAFVLTWILLRVIESRGTESFRNRMQV